MGRKRLLLWDAQQLDTCAYSRSRLFAVFFFSLLSTAQSAGFVLLLRQRPYSSHPRFRGSSGHYIPLFGGRSDSSLMPSVATIMNTYSWAECGGLQVSRPPTIAMAARQLGSGYQAPTPRRYQGRAESISRYRGMANPHGVCGHASEKPVNHLMTTVYWFAIQALKKENQTHAE